MTLSVFLRRAFVSTFLLALGAAPLAAQEAPKPVAPVVEQPDTAESTMKVSPRSAFISSLLVPGLGQWRVGAEKRAIAFTALQGASYYMLIKTIGRLGDVQDRSDERVGFITDSLDTVVDNARQNGDTITVRQLTTPGAYQQIIEADDTASHLSGLVKARKEQRQDWIAYTIAITMASAVDAFVAAHLSDFPTTITTRPRAGGGMEFQVIYPRRRR